jgi:hypothetical protein
VAWRGVAWRGEARRGEARRKGFVSFFLLLFHFVSEVV